MVTVIKYQCYDVLNVYLYSLDSQVSELYVSCS